MLLAADGVLAAFLIALTIYVCREPHEPDRSSCRRDSHRRARPSRRLGSQGRKTLMTRFSKFYLALTGGLLTWGAVVVKSASGAITSNEWLELAGVAVTALAVWFVPNS